MRSISREFRRGIEREVAAINEPLKEIKDDLAGPIAQIKEDLKGSVTQIESELNNLSESTSAEWVGPVASTGPTPEEAIEDRDRIDSGEDLLDGDAD